jgi:hypothetical protein
VKKAEMMQDDSRVVGDASEREGRSDVTKVRLMPGAGGDDSYAKVVCSLPAGKALEYVREVFQRVGCTCDGFQVIWDESSEADGFRVLIRGNFDELFQEAARRAATELLDSPVVQFACVYYEC